MNVAINLGSVAVALAILWANLRPWWKGGRDPKALLPFGAGAGIGSLATICVGGVLGWGAARAAGTSASLGEKGVATTTGVSGSSSLPVARMGVLTPEGAVVTVLLLVAVVLLFKASGKQDKRRIIGGALSFAILAFLPGVAATLQWWPQTVNWAGNAAVQALSSGGGLL